MTANITFTTGKHSFCGVNQLSLTISIGKLRVRLRADRDGHQEASDDEVREAIASIEGER